jgi:hypothetical protein
MSRRTYGILASVVGSALGAWWYARRRAASSARPAAERGTVIYDNTPSATPLSSEGII